MNKTYRSLFNTATGTWMAAPETAKGRKKAGGQRALVRSAVAVAAVTLSLGAAQAFAYVAGAGAVEGDPSNTVVGDGASASGKQAVAIGNDAEAQADDSVALGHGSIADRANSVSVGSIGNERQIVNVADGTQATDAVNFGQLTNTAQSVANALGGGATLAPNGTILAPTYTLQGTDFHTVGDALTNLDERVTTVENTSTTGSPYLAVRNPTGSAVANGMYSLAVGMQANAGGQGAVAVGSSASASANGAISMGQNNRASGTNSVSIGFQAAASAGAATALGAGAVVAGANAVGLGYGTTAAATGAVALGSSANVASSSNSSAALGQGARVLANTTSAVALGSGSVADRANTVSIGSSGGERQLANVAAGEEDTDAVNVSQLNQTNTQVANLQSTLADAVMYDDSTHSSVTLGGTSAAAPVVLHNVAPGVLDTDAVNMSQLNATNAQVSQNTTDITNLKAQSNPLIQVKGTTAASATGANNIAIGNGAQSNVAGTADGNIAIGSNAKNQNTGAGAIVLGRNATIQGTGGNGSVTGAGSIALGDGANVYGNNAVAIGPNATVTHTGSIAIGPSATFGANGTGLAIGNSASITTSGGVALGNSTSITANNAVAIGTGSVANRANTVSVGTTASTRQIVNVTAGTQSADAVNVSQLAPVVTALGGGASINATTGAVTGPTYNVQGGTQANVGDALDALDKGVNNNATSIANTTTNLSTLTQQINSGTIGLVQQAGAGSDLTVGAGTDGARVNFADKDGNARTLANVENGTDDHDAVNVSQLNATETRLGEQITTVNNNVTQLGDNITKLGDQITSGQIGLVQQAAAGADLTVGAGTDGARVNFADNSGNTRALANVSSGTADTDAVNVKQLRTELANTSAADTAYFQADGWSNKADAAKVAAGSYGVAIGSNASATGENSVALGANSVADRDNVVSVGWGMGGNGTRQIINVANGNENTDAVNVQQLKPVINGLGGGAKIDANTGVVTGPTYNVQGGTQHDVGTALDALDTGLTTAQGDIVNLDNRVTTSETNITKLQQQIGDGSVGLVQQDGVTRNITVAAGTDGSVVDFTGTAGARTLTGVADGNLSATSTDAVNGSQLYATNQNVAQNTTNISTLTTNVTNLDGRVTVNEGNISNLKTQIGNGSVGLVQQDATTGNITVAAGTAGSMVDFTGTAGARRLAGVADGTADTDAVNLRQLKQAGLVDGNGNALDAVTYDVGSDRTSVTFGSAGAPVLLSNVRAGMADTDAANVGQLRGMAGALGGGAGIGADGAFINPSYTFNDTTYNNVGDALNGLATAIGQTGDRMTVVEKVISTGESNAHVATTGDQTNVAVATGQNAVALGAGASASNDNSIALGAGSTTDRDNTISVGSAGNERAITNVADAVMSTDAVNKRTMDTAVAGAKSYTDQQIGMVQQALGDVSRKAYSGIAGATALTMIPDVDQGKTIAVGVGVGTYQGYTASAIGVSARLSDRIKVKMGASVSGAGSTYGAGASYQW